MTPELRMSELERKVAGLLRVGTVSALDLAQARARVTSGDLVTGWVPWLNLRAGTDRTWWAPDIGEQVALLCPEGDPSQGVILGALYQTAHPAPHTSGEVTRAEWADGSYMEVDRSAGRMTLQVSHAVINGGAQGAARVGDETLTTPATDPQLFTFLQVLVTWLSAHAHPSAGAPPAVPFPLQPPEQLRSRIAEGSSTVLIG